MPPEGWSADHLLLAALVRCSIDSFAYHARRAGHDASRRRARRTARSRRRTTTAATAFVAIDVRLDVQLTPRASDPATLIMKAERDCFVGASLTVKPEYEWHVS